MDVVVWLRSLGLGKYEAAFRENEIDETVLPSLTDEHLKELGVASFGHRVKLLDPIAALRSERDRQDALDTATASSAPTHQALEQQAATSEVLGVISSSQGELERGLVAQFGTLSELIEAQTRLGLSWEEACELNPMLKAAPA
jgi:hypothetical protein